MISKLLISVLLVVSIIEGVMLSNKIFYTSLLSTTSDIIYPKDDFVDLFNQYRLEHKLGRVRPDPTLCQLANLRIDEVDDEWSHNGFTSVVPNFRKDYPDYGTLGENLARGYFDPGKVIQAWDGSPEHKDNLTNPEYNRVCFSSNGGYIVQILGEKI